MFVCAAVVVDDLFVVRKQTPLTHGIPSFVWKKLCRFVKYTISLVRTLFSSVFVQLLILSFVSQHCMEVNVNGISTPSMLSGHIFYLRVVRQININRQ